MPEGRDLMDQDRTAQGEESDAGADGTGDRRDRTGNLSKLSVSSGVTGRAGGFGAISPCTDVYAIGATLYYMVTGIRPEKALDEPVPVSERDPAISASFQRVIERAMSQGPAERCSDAVQMLHALDDATEIDTGLRSLKRAHLVTVLLLVLLWAAGTAFRFLPSASCRCRGRVIPRICPVSQTETMPWRNGDYQKAEDAYNRAIRMKPEETAGSICRPPTWTTTGDSIRWPSIPWNRYRHRM